MMIRISVPIPMYMGSSRSATCVMAERFPHPGPNKRHGKGVPVERAG